ncbi:MAG: hypothetical protein HC800_13595 [Phormidesmis sp. RL_2_1]|nr:hypothetical protein [Phormidesmis sp. RL_2_1]
MVEAESQGLEKREKGRLSDEQKKGVQGRAISWRQKVVAIAEQKARGLGGGAFFPEVFRIASELIEKDTGEFCDHAQDVFDEIEAHGQEPLLDDDWVDEITGENNNFYFSTDNLGKQKQKEALPRRQRGRRPKGPDEKAVVKAVQEAVQSFEDALAVSHIEQPKEWIQAIRAALRDEGGRADFDRLKKLT